MGIQQLVQTATSNSFGLFKIDVLVHLNFRQVHHGQLRSIEKRERESPNPMAMSKKIASTKLAA
jgi:hypothetical protein